MIKRCLFLTAVSIFFSIAFTTHAEEAVINKKMVAALKKYNPRFVAWKTGDYTPTIQKDSIEKKRYPYALILDVNGDKKNDLILDGHDDKNSLLICLISTPKGYGVIVLRQIDLLNPEKLENMNDGNKETGLNYYLWPNKEGTGFTLAYPQQTDTKGNLLNDGAMIDYLFKDGEFQESYQTL
ncbi:MAG: hypothetical protein HY895_04875 [Deltaproteobacteria bacterium]|nr:hypothetical protein [Deltaproteobacteria bacterium]